MNDRWVDERLAGLQPAQNWKPNAALALARIRQKERTRIGWRRWSWAMAAACAGMVALFALPTQGTCAQRIFGVGCQQVAVADHAPGEYKQTGAAAAPLALEIYSDYECPACAMFFNQTLPLLVRDYVNTGKARIIHRDFPLPLHPYAKLAARYANAAGEIGRYDLAATQIFRTQAAWSSTGSIEPRLAEILPPGDLQKVIRLVTSDPRLEQTVANDMQVASRDQINQTPTLVIVARGNRQKVAPIPPYSVLKSYLDQLLSQ